MLPNKRISLTKPSSNRMCDTQGSIVLEASLVMPVFVMVLFFFVYMVQMTLLTCQLQSVASNLVKQVSAHVYPVALTIQANTANGTKVANGNIPKLSLTDWAEQYAGQLPSPISEWIVDAARKGDEPLQDMKNSISERVVDPVMKPMLKPFLEGTLLNVERLHVTRVTVPDMRSGQQPYFGIEISYELPIKVPFTNDRLVLASHAEERLWIGDTHELSQAGGDEGTAQGAPAVILSKPEPALAGHRASISARIGAGSTAKLTIYYKSGVSQAKYLGEATADGNGNVEWTWLVGGNTTPGTWSFVIETADGQRTGEQFTVESPK